MIQSIVKKISDLGYDVSWRYEAISNSFIIRARKGNYILSQRVDCGMDFAIGGCAGFEFYMDRYLVKMLAELEEREERNKDDQS